MSSPAFDAFFDDAAVFPPGNAPVDVAVKQHLGRQSTREGVHVGPFVCDVARLTAVLEAASTRLPVTLVGPADEVVPALTAVARSSVEIVGIELPGPRGSIPGAAVTSIAVELPWGAGFEVPPGAVLKLRCGGAYVPTIDELAAAIVHCVEHDQPFKLTAGLHAAIHRDGAHGFVNVMAGVVAATAGKDPAPVLSAGPDDLDLTTLAESRRLFRSIGTCSIDEPLADLRALGLVA